MPKDSRRVPEPPGCEKYGTEVMKKQECLLLVETAIENGSDIAEAFSDMRMIDTFKGRPAS